MTETPKNKMRSRISIIAAIGKNRALGLRGKLLWHIPDDMRRFKELTSGHPVIMGRRTWESIPEKFRPLPMRANILITRNTSYRAEGAEVCRSLEEALNAAEGAPGAEEVFIIGGGEIYALALPYANKLYLTLVDDEVQGDTFFPEYANEFTVVSTQDCQQNKPPYRFVTLERK